MKILFFAEFFPDTEDLTFTGGVESYNYFLVKEISKTHQVTVICRSLRKSKDFEKNKLKTKFKVIRVGIPVNRIDTGILTFPARIDYIFRSILAGLRNDADVIQGNNFVTYIPAYLISILKGKPSVVWYPDVFIGRWIKLTGILSGLFGEFVDRLSLKFKWSHFVALSNSTKQKLISQGINSEKISTIYAGIDKDFIKQIKSRKNKRFTLICVCRLVNYKRVDILIKAMKILISKNFQIHLSIIGDGPEKPSLLDQIDKLGLKNYITFESNLPREDLIKRFKSSHLFCLSSQEEGFGMAVTEAASCGLPYVVSNIPVLKEITLNGMGGELFKSGDHKDLAKKIEKIFLDKNLYKKLSIMSMKLAQNYNWKKVSHQFINIYQTVTKKNVRILMLVDAWYPHIGGGQIHAWELAKNLSLLGYQVTIFTRNLGPWNEQFPGVTVVRTNSSTNFYNLYGRIDYLIKSLYSSLMFKYDILHAHAFSPGLIVPFVKFIRNKPTVFTTHGVGVEVKGLPLGDKALENIVIYKIKYDLQISVASSTFTKRTAAKKLEIIPNGVNLDEYKSIYKKSHSIKRLLYVGRLSYEKGVDILISSFNKLNNKNLELIIVGDGPEKISLKTLAVGKRIKFLGKLARETIINEYSKADLVVLPSRTEGQPLVLFEAWAAKIPILVTNVGDNQLYIKNNVNGFICQPNIISMTNALKSILQNINLDNIADNGYQDVQKYSWSQMAKKTHYLYQELIST